MTADLALTGIGVLAVVPKQAMLGNIRDAGPTLLVALGHIPGGRRNLIGAQFASGTRDGPSHNMISLGSALLHTTRYIIRQ